ncbi:Putative uncharacterized protein yogA [Thermobacillus xylanilyticus]|uniref:DUF4395 domain-containing protein n=1 Tax=Thermobacillus xylanilyticus TaxID=76633 RepID=A0ABM8V1Y7_THEXY|nr:DUF4395 domain-containing protein [Thermobacillus xylanilyticus]CAG5081969.1 Putative uncharacterized protein yogA [Thermobacillus xylanilyticus]
MMEIPLPLIKANQAGIVLFVVIALASQQPWWIYALFLIQLAGLAFGPQASLFILLARSALADERLRRSETQAAELARFNQTIAVLLLGLSSVFHLAGWSWPGHIASGMVGLAALAALAGYCIGCTIYYQYKRWRALRAR